jgi:hypothetical protein
LIIIAAGVVLPPGAPLGLLANAVQTLAGVLLPSATVFLLLLCNDEAVLGPWVNGRFANLFTGGVIAVLVTMSVILTASVLFPEQTDETVIFWILGGGAALSVGAAIVSSATRPDARTASAANRGTWRMPPLAKLAPARLSKSSRLWMGALRLYLVIAGGLMLARIVALAVNS